MKKALCTIGLMLALFTGCSTPKTKISTKPIDHRRKWMALATIVKSQIKTDLTIEEMAAELSYLHYLKGK